MAEIEVKINIIKDVSILYPDLVSEGFKEIIIKEYNEIQEIKDLIYSHRDSINSLENLLKTKKESFNKKCSMVELVYETKSYEKLEATDTMKALHRKGKVY